MRFNSLVLILLAWTTVAGQPTDLGSGHRGLVFAKTSFDPSVAKNTFLIACRTHPGMPVAGDFRGPKEPALTKVLIIETLSQDYVDSLGKNFFNGWTSTVLYSMGPDCAFSFADLYKIEHGHLRIYPGAAQAEAQRRYGLTPEQIFLGAFDGRVYFWVNDKPRELLVRALDHLYRIPLGRRVTKPLGISKGDQEGELALFRVAKPWGWIHVSPRSVGWDMINIKEAVPLE